MFDTCPFQSIPSHMLVPDPCAGGIYHSEHVYALDARSWCECPRRPGGGGGRHCADVECTRRLFSPSKPHNHRPHPTHTLNSQATQISINSESLIFVGSPAADCPWHLSSEIRFLKSKADSPSKATTPPKRHKSKLPNPSHLIRAWQVRERVHRAVCRFRSPFIQHFWNCGRDCLGRRDRSLGERHLLG